MAGRHIALHEPDRGRRGLLHHQGLARSGLGLPAGDGARPAHRHPAPGHTPADRHPCGSSCRTTARWPFTTPSTRPPYAARSPAARRTIGVDKGYTEAYADSEGERYGEGPDDWLAAESDARKVKGQRRNQLRAVERKHREAGRIKKADNIRRNNLGNRKWDRRQKKHTAQTRDFLCHAAHRVVDRAGTIACEDLTAPMSSSKYRHRDTNRRLSGWVKGVMADTLTSISRRRGSALVLVNPAYTSQIDSRTGLLQGTRRGDRFYGLDGVVLDADTNAARNILQRMYDDEITLYTPYREVKRLLLDRNGTPDGDCSSWTRACQAAGAALTGRERITRPCLSRTYKN